MGTKNNEKWNNIYQSASNELAQPAIVLTENLHLLPKEGTALDLACGLGANALLLAQTGLDVHAWDYSQVAIQKLSDHATSLKLTIYTEQRDVVAHPPASNSFDIIVVTRFLDRKIIPQIIDALKAGGLLFYQTFTRNKLDDAGPSNPDYLLDTNELLQLFNQLTVVYYREESHIGDLTRGHRNEAMLVAIKSGEN